MGPRSICRSGRAGRGWVGIIPTQCTYRSVSAGAALACMSSRASVRSQVSPFDREVARGGGRWNGEKKRKKCRRSRLARTQLHGHISPSKERLVCLCVCVCAGSGAGLGPKRMRSPSITVWRSPPLKYPCTCSNITKVCVRGRRICGIYRLTTQTSLDRPQLGRRRGGFKILDVRPHFHVGQRAACQRS